MDQHTYRKGLSSYHIALISRSSYARDSFKPRSLNDFAKLLSSTRSRIMCACVCACVCVWVYIYIYIYILYIYIYMRHTSGQYHNNITISQPSHHYSPTDMWNSPYELICAVRIPDQLRVWLPGLSHYQHGCERMPGNREWRMKDMQGIEVLGICVESELNKYRQIRLPFLSGTWNK